MTLLSSFAYKIKETKQMRKLEGCQGRSTPLHTHMYMHRCEHDVYVSLFISISQTLTITSFTFFTSFFLNQVNCLQPKDDEIIILHILRLKEKML